MYIQSEREIKTISPTSLSAWLRCRADWYNRYILKSDRDGTWNMMVGNAVHLGTYLMHSGLDWEQGVRDFWNEHSAILSDPECPSLDEVLTLLRVYKQMNPRHEGDVGEKYFKVEVPGLDKPLTGIFDLLPGREAGIVEFKTGGWWTQARADLAMQTIHYSLAYREIYQRMPVSFTYYAFEFTTKKVRRIRTGVTEQELDEFIPYVASLQREMEHSIILPRCQFKDNNQTCWYPEQCGMIMESIRQTSRDVMPPREKDVISKSGGKGRKKRSQEKVVP